MISSFLFLSLYSCWVAADQLRGTALLVNHAQLGSTVYSIESLIEKLADALGWCIQLFSIHNNDCILMHALVIQVVFFE